MLCARCESRDTLRLRNDPRVSAVLPVYTALVRNACTLHVRCAIYEIFFFVLGQIECVNAQNARTDIPIPGSAPTRARPADYRAHEEKKSRFPERGGNFFFAGTLLYSLFRPNKGRFNGRPYPTVYDRGRKSGQIRLAQKFADSMGRRRGGKPQKSFGPRFGSFVRPHGPLSVR